MYLHAPTYGRKGWRGGCGRAMGVSHKTFSREHFRAGDDTFHEMVPKAGQNSAKEFRGLEDPHRQLNWFSGPAHTSY